MRRSLWQTRQAALAAPLLSSVRSARSRLAPLLTRTAPRHLLRRTAQTDSAIMSGWQWQQTMLRIKDPVASVDYYTKNYGMTLLAKCDFPQWDFALYFLATLPEGTTYDLDPNSQEAQDYLWKGEYNGHKNVALELTHNYGTESIDGPVYHAGNAMECEELGKGGRDGFGHIAFNCNDVYAACSELEAAGVTFKKKPDEGMMKGLAFAYDPDGYWVEICSRGGAEGHGIDNKFNLSQTMMRIKDPAKTIPFCASPRAHHRRSPPA